MDITPVIPKGKNLINAYGSDYVIINERKHPLPLLITPDKIIPSPLELGILSSLTIKPEILLIGHQLKQMRLNIDYAKYLEELKISYETMSFGSAYRTYNVLLAEGRNIAAWCVFG